MRTRQGIEDLITGIIIGFKFDDQFERKSAKRIIEALIDEDNLSISPIDDSLFRNFIRSNHLTKKWDKFFEQNAQHDKLKESAGETKSCTTCFYSQNGKTSCDRHVNPIKPDYSKGVECAANNYAHYKPAINKQTDENGMIRFLKLCEKHKNIMDTKNILIMVYTNASGFLWSMCKVDSGTDLGDSGYNGNCENSGTFKEYSDALEDAIILIEKCDLKKFEEETPKNQFHWGNYASHLNKKYRKSI